MGVMNCGYFENEWKNVNNEKLVKNILETFVNTRERSPT